MAKADHITINVHVTGEPAEVAKAVAAAMGIASSDALPDDADLTGQVVKAVDEQRYTLAVAYPAMKPDVSKAQDGHRDFMAPDALEETAWRYMAKSRELGLCHVDGTEGHGTVVESYVYRGPDWTVKAADGSEQVIKAGDWLLGVIWDQPAWAEIKAGRFGGMSPQGMARRSTPSPERLAELRS